MRLLLKAFWNNLIGQEIKFSPNFQHELHQRVELDTPIICWLRFSAIPHSGKVIF